MNANEIVRALRDMATYDCGFEQQSDTAKDAADLFTWRGPQAEEGDTE